MKQPNHPTFHRNLGKEKSDCFAVRSQNSPKGLSEASFLLSFLAAQRSDCFAVRSQNSPKGLSEASFLLSLLAAQRSDSFAV